MLERLSDNELITGLKSFHGNETDNQIRTFQYLNELARRGTYVDRGSNSLYKVLEKELRYDKRESYLRIRAAQAFALHSKFEQAYREHRLYMTTLKEMQVAFIAENRRRRAEKLNPLMKEEKIALIEQAIGKSVDEARRLLAEAFPHLKKDVERKSALKDGRTQITCAFSPEAMAKFERLMDLKSHTNFDRKFEVLFEQLADLALQKLDPEVKPKRERKPTAEEQLEMPIVPKVALKRRKISAEVERQVRARDNYCCQFANPITGERCLEKHGVQMEHIITVAHGGTNDISNLTLLCGIHNRRAAEKLGLKRPITIAFQTMQ